MGFLTLKYFNTFLYLTIVVLVGAFFTQIFFFSYLFNERDDVPVLLWWTPFFVQYNELIECKRAKYKCLVTGNRSIDKPNVYLFYGSHIENYDFPLPRDFKIPWALFHEESPKNYAPILFEETQLLFNITSTFSQNSDLPITTQYLGQHEFNLLQDQKYYVPVEIKNLYLKSIAPVLYIQSDCDTPIGRDNLVTELAKYVNVDSYGKCLNNKEFPERFKKTDNFDLYNEEYLHFISKYKFIIAFENAICDDYTTEKLWRPLIVGAIPIYLGSPLIEKWLPNPTSAILVKNFENLKQVANFIHRVNANDTLYNTFLEHKTLLKISNQLLQENVLEDNPILVFQCYICEKIYKSSFEDKAVSKSVYNCPKSAVSNNTTWDHHWIIGKCQSKALKILLDKNIPFKQEFFEDFWKKILLEKNC